MKAFYKYRPLFFVFILINLFSCNIFKNHSETKKVVLQNTNFEKFQMLFCEANKSLLFNNQEKAEQFLNEALLANPQSACSYYVLSNIKISQHATEQAALFAKKAVELQPLNYWYRKNYADILESLNRYREATDVYIFLIQNNQENKQTYQNLLKLAEVQNNVPDQIKYLNILLQIYDFTEEDALKIYDLYLKQKDLTNCEKTLDKLILSFPENRKYPELKIEFYIMTGSYDKAKKMLDQLLNIFPNDGTVHLSYASYCKLMNDKTEFYTQVKLVFLSDDVNLETKVRIIISDPGTDFTNEQTEELINILLESYSDSKIVHILYSDFLLKNNQFPEAVQNLKYAVSIDNSDFNLIIKLLQLELEIKEYSGLYSDSQSAIDFFPNQPILYFYNGFAAFRLNDYNNSIKILNIGYSLIIDDVDLQSQYLFYIAQSQYYLKMYSESDSNFEKLLLLQPGNPDTYEVYAHNLATRNINPEKAKKLAEAALKYNSKSSTANLAVAILHFNFGSL